MGYFVFTLVFLLGRRCRRILPGAGSDPAARPGSVGTRRSSGLGHGAGTIPLLPLNYQKVKQGMEADGNCCRQQAHIPECVAGLWPALLPPPSHPHPWALCQTLTAE